MINVARGLVIYPKTIEAAVMAELPFMSTEEILMAGVRAGGDRQALHEAIRVHSHAAAEQVKALAKPNDLMQRLAKEPALAKVDLNRVLDPAAYIGRAPQQVESFIRCVVTPVRRRYADALTQAVELKV